MNNNAPTSNAPTSKEPTEQEEALTPRLAYEAPELMIYNQSAITMGGVVPHGMDVIGSATSYKS